MKNGKTNKDNWKDTNKNMFSKPVIIKEPKFENWYTQHEAYTGKKIKHKK